MHFLFFYLYMLMSAVWICTFFVLVNGLQVQYAKNAAPRSANVILKLTGQNQKCT